MAHTSQWRRSFSAESGIPYELFKSSVTTYSHQSNTKIVTANSPSYDRIKFLIN